MSEKVLGIDASRSLRDLPTGVEVYSTAMIQALIAAKPEAGLRLYVPHLSPHFPKRFQRVIRLPRLWSLVRLSLEMLLHKPDALFVPAHVLPFFAPKRSFVTIHDVAFERYPMAYGGWQSFYLGWSTKRAVRKSEVVIVPTEAVKKDLKKFYGAKNVEVIHHGVTALPKLKKVDVLRVLEHYEIDPTVPLFFFVGRLETKKNLLVLLEAWAKVQKNHPNARLFLGGMHGHGWETLFDRMEKEDVSGTVVAPGYLSDLEVAALFQHATALVFPSLEEGFGLPMLQAFMSGCAVICSDIPALREVGENAALYAKAGDPDGFALHMAELINKPKKVEDLVKRGAKHLKEFSWEKAAKQMLELMELT